MTMRRRLRLGLACLLGSLALTVPMASQAVPSFARQTGQDCASCHVGAYGPHLTPFGVKFKLGGYTDSDGKAGHVPLSAMLVASNTHTDKALDEAPAGYKTNNNTALDEASLFIAGKLVDKLGAFVQITYDGIEKSTALDQMDLRFAHATDLSGKDLILGASLNNNPGVQDPFNTLPVWGFPFTGSAFGFGGPESGSLINGALEQRVLGLSGYAFYDNRWYAELGTYRSLSPTMQSKFGLGREDDPGRLGGDTAYWRLAWFEDHKSQAWSAGLFGLRSSVFPDRASGTPNNRYDDVGIDGQYQWLGTREHIFTLQGSYLRERQRLTAMVAAGEAEKAGGSLHELKLNASYYFRQTWGASLGYFRTTGSADTVLYGGNTGFKPDTVGHVIQVDWTPLGKEDSWAAPWANLRLGAQYTSFSKFNGAGHNYDGAGRDAADNNTLFLFAWTSF